MLKFEIEKKKEKKRKENIQKKNTSGNQFTNCIRSSQLSGISHNWRSIDEQKHQSHSFSLFKFNFLFK